MKKALVSTIEKFNDTNGKFKGNRIVDVQNTPFEVHESLFWVDCADETNMDDYYYDGVTCKKKDWVVFFSDEEIAAINVRFKRDQLLQDSDLIVTKNYEKGTPVPTEWVEYRQALRDSPEQAGFPMDVIFPTKPSN